MSSMPGGTDDQTYRPQSAGSKQIKCEHLPSIGTAASIGKDDGNKSAPTSRVYTKDYSKVAPEKGDTDMVGPFLGNPLRW
jgi:hypothetical protein